MTAYLLKKYVEDKDPAKVPSEVNKALCENCTICCEHVAIEIDKPESIEDFQNIIWYVIHENISVFIDHDDDWIIEFKTPCKALTQDGLCSIHSNRPKICVDYTQDTCERNDGDPPFKRVFRSRQDVIDYVRDFTKFDESSL